MTSTFPHRSFARRGSVAALALAVLASTLSLSSMVASATALEPGTTCATPITSAPTAPATVSAATTPDYQRTLVVGTGPNAGCELYLLTSDQPPAYACSGVCATTIWPALLTKGAPIAGTGVNPTLLGTVTRTDIVANTSVQQVTYAGSPVYQFFLNKAPGETHGANLFDPATTPAGVWYLLSPGRGLPDPGVALLSPETLTVTIKGISHSASVLTAFEDQGLVPATPTAPAGLPFPVYTFSADSDHQSACLGQCAVVWPPVLTTQRAQAINGADPNLVGIIVRPDGSHQVTYAGHPLYLFRNDAVFPGTPVVAKGQGLGGGFGGTFSLIPPQ